MEIEVSKPIPTKRLSDVVESITRGLSSYYIQPSGMDIFYVNIGDVTDGSISLGNVQRVKAIETQAVEKSRLKPSDVIITTKGSSFRAAIAPEAAKGYVISSNLIAFKLKPELLPELLVAYLNSPHGQTELAMRATGIAQKSLNLKTLLEITIPIPGMKAQKVLAEYLSLSNQHDALAQEEQQLRTQINNMMIRNLMLG